jgi:hypothetical protein
MSFVNTLTRELFLKIVYCGPGMCGKTANVRFLHDTADPARAGKLVSLNTESERTLFFDFMPLTLGELRGYTTKLQIYTVPGQIFYRASRRLILRGVDGLVFVADSQTSRFEANTESLEEMHDNLDAVGTSFAELPHVFQFNKRDLPDIVALDDMRALLATADSPVFEAVASRGQGVADTLRAVTRLVLARHGSRQARVRSGG